MKASEVSDFDPAQASIPALSRDRSKRSRFVTTDALRRTWLYSLLSGLCSIPAVIWPWRADIDLPFEALITFAVGMMLSIRVRSAYERWWEGRTQWGLLVNASRTLAIKLRQLADLEDEERVLSHRLIQGFARSLKYHLRGSVELRWIRGFEGTVEQPAHVPTYIASQIYRLCSDLRARGRLSEISLLAIDEEARVLLGVCGACERIKNTPMLPSFPAFLRLSMVMLCLSLPWRLAVELGWWTVPSMVLATFFIWGGESVAQAADHPFGRESDDLDLEAFCGGIDQVTAEVLGVPMTQPRQLSFHP